MTRGSICGLRFGLIFAFLLLVVEAAGGGIARAEDVLAEDASLGSAPAASTPVTQQEVWQALAEDLAKIELAKTGTARVELPTIEELDLPVSLPARAGRRLRVQSRCWDRARRRIEFRLECGVPRECLPFLAYLRDPLGDPMADSEVRAAWAPPCGPSARASVAASTRLPEQVAAKPVVRAGERAIAILVTGGMRMTGIVTCLEGGREGEIIRVRTEEGNTFRARVAGPGRLEALPR